MKNAVFLAVTTLLSSQLLFAQYSQDQPGSLAGNISPEDMAAVFPEVPESDGITGFGLGEGMHRATANFPDQFLSPVKDTVYHLEFESEKGITLPGASAFDLLNPAPCLAQYFPALTQINQYYRILVFINDQPSRIRATNVTAALRQIPAESIKAIDIRNAPADNSDPADEVNIIIRVTKVM